MPAIAPLELRLKIEAHDGALRAGVRFPEPDLDAGPFPFSPPLDEQVREQLRWYLEAYSRWPTGEEARAARVEAQLEGWGRALFDAVFAADATAMRLWSQFRAWEPGRARLVTLDSTEPEALRLPWELLADEEGHLFALGIGFRRRLHKAQAATPRAFDLPVRVLMVIARPEGQDVAFIDPRASSQALLEAVKPLGERVAVEFLPAGTLRALTDRLNPSAGSRQPPVHVVHFDGHGVYATQTGLGYLLFEDAQGRPDRVDADRLGALLARAGIPLMVLDACQSAHADTPDPYSSVAQRLIRAGVGSVVAMQYSVLVPTSKQFFAAFYRALAEGATVGGAMDAGRYDLLADTFRFLLHRPDGSDRPIHLKDWFLPALYQQMSDPAPFGGDGAAAGQPAGEAADPFARYEAGLARLPGQFIHDDPAYLEALALTSRLTENLAFARRDGDTETRRAERNAVLHELDRLCERALGLPFTLLLPDAPSPSLSLSPSPTPPTALLGDAPAPRYDFTGRARELWRLERLLLEKRIVVIHAFGGQGKTALAVEAAGWLKRKGRFARAAFLSFEHGGDRDWTLAQLGRLLVGANFAALGDADRLPALQAALAAAPTLLIWDNVESLLPRGNAELPPEALRALLDLGATLAGPEAGEARLLLTTRDAALPHAAFQPGREMASLPLGGLPHWEALDLAGTVLDALGHERPPRLDLERLLEFLGGHPLSIQLVLPHVQDYPDVATVIARFEELYPGFTAGEAQRRDESLEVSLRFSLDRLSADVRDRLPALGVFEGGALEMMILPVAGLTPSAWQPVRAELERAGLVTPEIESPLSIKTAEGDFGGHYLRFHPTLVPHLRRHLEEADRAALETAYRGAYYQLAGFLYHNDARAPLPTRAVAQRELPNLRRAVERTLAAGDLDTAVTFVEYVELFLNVFGRQREREALVAAVERAVTQHATRNVGALTKAEFLLQSRRGELLRDTGRVEEAEEAFRALLARMTPSPDSPPPPAGEGAGVGAYDRALTLGRLGRCLRSQGRAGAAEAEYRRALEVLAGLDASHDDVRRQVGTAHTDLADVLCDQGRYAEAREHYEAAVEIVQALRDARSEAAVLGQLGTLALMEGDYAEAERRYHEALERFRALGETRSEAIFWHQLGRVYQEVAARAPSPTGGGGAGVGALQQAEDAYLESLRLEEALGDKALAAMTANQLAIVAKMAGRPADAERWSRRTIQMGEEVGDAKGVAIRCNNLADLLLSVARSGAQAEGFAGRDLLSEAEDYAHRAREIKESIGDLSLAPWTTYNILAEIAELKRGPGAGCAWQRKERAAYVAFPGHWANLSQQWGPVVQTVALVARTSSPLSAPPELEAALKHREEHGWGNVVAALRAILGGARDAEALADAHNLDRKDYLIVIQVLEAIQHPATSS